MNANKKQKLIKEEGLSYQMSNQISYESLLEKYYEDNILLETLVGINDAILGDNAIYLENIFDKVPRDPVEIQRRLLSFYQKTSDIQYLQAYHEVAIRAQEMNKRHNREAFPINETYPEFMKILIERNLTIRSLAIMRDYTISLLNI